MKFSKICDEFIAGKKIRLIGWPKDDYITFDRTDILYEGKEWPNFSYILDSDQFEFYKETETEERIGSVIFGSNVIYKGEIWKLMDNHFHYEYGRCYLTRGDILIEVSSDTLVKVF